jgi:adenine-specific DNA glycosylase
MDLGATVCVARKPRCLVCPMTKLCAAFPHNPENEWQT